jgi:benzoyl-CoA reductase/2-hydroxyglutaryl-CoA dehydratase subunit BcrC/BadD/HgdB
LQAVVASVRDAIELLRIYARLGDWVAHKQKATGKNFLASDFKPEHLRVIYQVYNDDMIRQYLEGKLQSKLPKLVRQF